MIWMTCDLQPKRYMSTPKSIKTCVAHVLGLVRDIPKQRMQCERVTFDLKPLSTQISICHRKNIYDMSIYTSIIYEYIYIYTYI